MQVVTDARSGKRWKIGVLPACFIFFLTVLLLWAGTGYGVVHFITVENPRFDVDDDDLTQIDTLSISVMDTVQWDWVEGFHTITSGLSSNPAHNPGDLFDVPSDPSNTIFQFAFTEAGDVPYFCIPHEFLDMKGVIRVLELTGIDGEMSENSSGLPRAFTLSQNYPNPFNPATTITFEIGAAGENHRVSLEVFNLRGRKVITLLNEDLPGGRHSAVWDGVGQNGRTLGSGVYFYRLTVDDRSLSRRMLLSK